MRFWSEARPSVQVDANKDPLEKKSQPCDSKAQAESGAVAAHQPGPEDPELEGQDRTGNGTERELDGHHNGPAAGDPQGDRVVLEDADAIHQQGIRGERDAEGDHDDVVGKRERHLNPTWKEGIGGEVGVESHHQQDGEQPPLSISYASWKIQLRVAEPCHRTLSKYDRRESRIRQCPWVHEAEEATHSLRTSRPAVSYRC